MAQLSHIVMGMLPVPTPHETKLEKDARMHEARSTAAVAQILESSKSFERAMRDLETCLDESDGRPIAEVEESAPTSGRVLTRVGSVVR